MSNPSSPGSPSKIFIDIDSSADEYVGFDLTELKKTLNKENLEEDKFDVQSASTDSETEEAFRVNFYEESSSSDEDEEKDKKVGGEEVNDVNRMDDSTTSPTKKKRRRKRKKGLTDPNKFAIKRDKIKMKIMKGVMDQVLPDIGAYDSKSTVGKDNMSSNGFVSTCCRLFGCMSSSLNEGVRFSSLKSINRTIRKLQRSKKLEEHINAYDENGRTPLINAIMTRKLPDPDDPTFFPLGIIERLIEVGADLNAPDELFGMTPLIYACSLKDEETAMLLLTKGADPHMCDFRACTPIMLCSGQNLVGILTVLLHRLADIDAQDEHGWTSLHFSAWGGYSKCTKLLLQNGADRSIRDNNKRKAIDIARYREDYAKKNPPLTHDEIKDAQGRTYGECIANLEDTKSRLADLEEEDIEAGVVAVL